MRFTLFIIVQPLLAGRHLFLRICASGYQRICHRLAGVSAPTSVIGTKRTNRAGLLMSVVRGRPEVAFQGRQVSF